MEGTKEIRESFLGHNKNPYILRLYAGHFLSRWGARMWGFSVGLYMINIWPDTLLLAAVYGLVEAASTALFGPIIGKLVDRLTYVKVLRLWLSALSLSFIVAGATVTSLLVYPGLRFSGFPMFVSLVVLTNVSGAISDLSTLAGTIFTTRKPGLSDQNPSKSPEF